MWTFPLRHALFGLFALSAVVATGQLAPRSAAETPETVIITLRPKTGADSGVVEALHEHWRSVQRLEMVLPHPHATLRGVDESGRSFYVEVLTWRDGSRPDNAPPEVRRWWDRMTALTEKRASGAGLEIREFSLVP